MSKEVLCSMVEGAFAELKIDTSLLFHLRRFTAIHDILLEKVAGPATEFQTRILTHLQNPWSLHPLAYMSRSCAEEVRFAIESMLFGFHTVLPQSAAQLCEGVERLAVVDMTGYAVKKTRFFWRCPNDDDGTKKPTPMEEIIEMINAEQWIDAERAICVYIYSLGCCGIYSEELLRFSLAPTMFMLTRFVRLGLWVKAYVRLTGYLCFLHGETCLISQKMNPFKTVDSWMVWIKGGKLCTRMCSPEEVDNYVFWGDGENVPQDS